MFSITLQTHAETSMLNDDATEKRQKDVIDACMSATVISANSGQTIKRLRRSCSEKVSSIVQERIILEQSVINNPFAILPHKPNYILPVTYSELDEDIYDQQLQNYNLDNLEAKFQISIKYIAIENMLTEDLNLEVAFTTTSWWQSYNQSFSTPFRETNYEPELIFSYLKPWSLMNLAIKNSFVSINHQSNGQAGSLSRSWNRIIGGLAFEHNNIVWGVQTWWRLPENDKEEPDDPAGDDNPNIEKYLGYGQLGVLWKLPRNHNLEVMLRNNLRNEENKGAIELGWSFPFTNQLQGYVQYFDGYGESLIHYNRSTERLGIGIKLTDWL
jgi:phospholipase A1